MRLLLVVAVVFTLCLLQGAVVPLFSPWWLRPHLPLLLLALWALRRGWREALALALLAGLFLGLMSSEPLGVAIIALALAAWAAQGASWRAVEGGVLAALGVVLLASSVYHLLDGLLLQALGYPVPWWPGLAAALAGGALINALLTPLFYWPLGWARGR